MIERIIAASTVATCYCARNNWLSLTLSPLTKFRSGFHSVLRQSAPGFRQFTPGIDQPAPKACDFDHNLLGFTLYERFKKAKIDNNVRCQNSLSDSACSRRARDFRSLSEFARMLCK